MSNKPIFDLSGGGHVYTIQSPLSPSQASLLIIFLINSIEIDDTKGKIESQPIHFRVTLCAIVCETSPLVNFH